MGLINLLTSIYFPSLGNLSEIAIENDWICQVINWLITFVGDVGLGIIVFTVILKLITLPLDIFSRASTKKNALKMEMMKDDLEKLKKQYKNNEQLYQQKMMALYKKNGYSAFSACLPTIVTLVFFIIVIGAFNSYSRFADKAVFVKMGSAYDESLNEFVDDGILIKEDGTSAYKLNINKAIENKNFTAYFNGYSEGQSNIEIETYSLNWDLFLQDKTLLETYPKLKEYLNEELTSLNESNGDLLNRINSLCHDYIIDRFMMNGGDVDALLGEGVIRKDEVKNEENEVITTYLYIRDIEGFIKKVETNEHLIKYFDVEKKEIKHGVILDESSEIRYVFEDFGKNFVCAQAITFIGEEYKENVVLPVARKASADAYEKNASRSVIFPWVKNLWVVDSPFSRAIPTIQDLENSIGAENMGSLKDENVYNELTAGLANYKETGFGKGNGWFILVALSILTMLGSTLIMNKQQKTQMELSSVDGENSTAASTQKMMTWMMPIMFGIFAFIYSAAFSIYMITSSLLSTGFTLLINYLVELSFKKKLEKEAEEKASKAKYGKRRD